MPRKISGFIKGGDGVAMGMGAELQRYILGHLFYYNTAIERGLKSR